MSSLIRFEGLSGVGGESPHCYLLTVDDFTFLLDCGWDDKFDKDYIQRLSKAATRIDCVLLSFPDTLHLGAFPYLYAKCQLTCPVYATIPVKKTGQMVMYDWYQSHHNYDDFDLFNLDDVDNAFDDIHAVKYNQSINMRGKGLGMSISACPAGHMLGGSMWRICREGEDDIVYAVDFNHKKERHLGGCELEKLFRPSLLITDAMNATYKAESRKSRDTSLVEQIQSTCRAGGNVLLATDTGGRSLEICHLLEQMWSMRESGLSAYTLAILSNTSYHVINGAKQMIEWMSDKLTKSFDSSRANPFSFKHIHICHSLVDLAQLSSPKVVMASFPDLSCGFSRELFMQWAPSSKNSIILTTTPARGSLAHQLLTDPHLKSVRLIEKRRILLEGEELEEHLAMVRQHKALQRMKEHAIDSSSDEGEEELQLIESGKHDIVCLQQKGGQGVMRSSKQHAMFPHHDERHKADEYGEWVNPADYENIRPLVEGIEDEEGEVVLGREVVEIEEPPSKCVSQEVNLRVEASVRYMDFEGRTDGESVCKIIQAVTPGEIILVRATPSTLLKHSAALRTALPSTPIHTPSPGHVVAASTNTEMQKVRLSNALLRSLQLYPVEGGAEVAWLQGRTRIGDDDTNVDNVVTVEDSEDVLMVDIEDQTEMQPHSPVLIGELRLSDFKQVLSKAGITAEFSAGILWCHNRSVALRKQEAGNIALEGALSEKYFEIRELLYTQYAVL